MVDYGSAGLHPVQVRRPSRTAADVEVAELQFSAAVARAVQLEKILHAALPECRVVPMGPIKDVTVKQFRNLATLILAGVTPVIAAQQTLYCSAMAFNKMMKDGRAALPGTPLGEFYRAVNALRCRARGIAEARLYFEDPKTWGQQIGGRSDEPEEPVWGETVRHTGPDGVSAPVVGLRISFDTSGGVGIKKELKDDNS